MKRMKRLILILLLMSVTTGCTQDIVLHQPASEIVQINLVYSPFNQYEIIYSLEEDEFVPFLDVLQTIQLHKNSSPQNIGGGLIVQIGYKDGSIDLLGSWSVGYKSNDVLEHDGWYCVSEDDLYDLFSEYVDISQLPNL